jgi:hypothetical protein
MGQLEQMIAYHKAHGMLENMSDERAMEMQARKPNMLRRQMLLNTVPAELEGLRGGGKAGLQRIVGGARKMKAAEAAAERYLARGETSGKGKLTISHGDECDDSDKESEASDEKEDMKGGFLPFLAAAAVPLLGKLFGNGKPMKRGAGAKAMGRELGKHIKDLHGEGFLDDLVSGIGSVVGKIFGAGSPAGEASATPAVNVYSRGIAPKRTVPGSLEARGQQVPDYAPKWFRESGDIAGGAKDFRTMGYEQTKRVMEQINAAKPAHAGKGMSGGAKAPRALSDRQKARNALVRKLMTEKGMKLPEASRYIKEHGLI